MKTKNNENKQHLFKSLVLIISISLFGTISTYAQDDNILPPEEPIKLNGPRIGFTYIGPGTVTDKLEENEKVPYITQFGWQFENRFFTLSDGTSGLFELILLAGGLEQNMILPSATLLFGLRTGKGLEFGAGPNLSIAGAGFAIACGYTIKAENIFFPINLAVVPSSSGVRFSVLVGFNARTKFRQGINK